MDKRELHMYKVQDVVEDLLQDRPVKSIARIRKISKNTVKKYRGLLNKLLVENPNLTDSVPAIMDEIQKYRKEERFSDNFGWLERNTTLVEDLSGGCDNYVRLVEVLQEHGFKGSYSSLLRYLDRNTRQSESPIVRIETKPGHVAQVDFGSAGKIYDEVTGAHVKAYVFVMVLGYSRDAYREIVKSQDITTWCNCHIHAFEYFGGVPEVIIPDNLKSAIVKASFMDPVANKSYADLARHYNFQIDPCLPGTPEHKGKVESGVKYVKNNFFPLREFKNFTDANEQLMQWEEHTARVRIHGTTRRQPGELFEKYEKDALRPLPHDRFEITLWKDLKVARDIHVQCNYAYYSVPCELRGEQVQVRITSSQIAIFHENRLVAVHFPAPPGRRRTNYEHYPPDKSRFMKWDTDYCISLAGKTGPNTLQVIQKLLQHEPIRNMRSAQNILRKAEKYGAAKLESACACAVHFGNYTYQGIKNILEKDLDTTVYVSSETKQKKLDASFARDINQILSDEAPHGNYGTN
jgi:transposase